METIGGKAVGLRRLQKEKGVNVPPFIVVAAEHFDHFQTAFEQDENLAKVLEQFQLPTSLQSSVQTFAEQCFRQNAAVIVRSSAAGEDGKSDAYAGILSSYSGLTNTKEVTAAITACAASTFSSKAIAYRKQKGLTTAIKPAVIVQRQINAEVSGVMFSTYPAYSRVMAINAVWGLGSGLVDGMLVADEYYLLKSTGNLEHQQIVEKDKKAADDGSFVDVASDMKHEPCLSTQMQQKLFTIGKHLEAAWGLPLDFEFAIAKDELYIVQARPITQAISECVVYDNSNIQESYNGVTTPLTFSFAQRAYATVYRQTMQILSLPQRTILEYEPVIENLLGLVKGRIYYNINNWYRGLQLLPSFSQNKADMERMMGVEEPIDFVEDKQLSLVQKIKRTPRLLLNLMKLLVAFAKRKKRIASFTQNFEETYCHFYKALSAANDATSLLGLKVLLDERLLQNWSTPIINDFYLMMMNGKVRRSLSKIGVAEPDDFVSHYFAGKQDVASTQQATALIAIASEAKKDSVLTAMLTSEKENKHQIVAAQYPNFYKSVANYIEEYGDRTVGELKLETVTMRVAPRIFYSYLRNFLVHEPAKINDSKSSNEKPAKPSKKLQKQLAKLLSGIQQRELMRLQRTRLFGIYRSIYLNLGKLLAVQRVLQDQRDIFYLSEDEIMQTVADGKTQVDIQKRKSTFEQFKTEELPARIIQPAAPYAVKEKAECEGTLSGTGCVPGIVSGEVIVIKSPEDDLNVQGKIVCAQRTDPGWVALFPTCKAVLIEKGAPLSHSVILLREFGIPTIINIKGLTKTLKSGDRITIDGSEGSIKMENG